MCNECIVFFSGLSSFFFDLSEKIIENNMNVWYIKGCILFFFSYEIINGMVLVGLDYEFRKDVLVFKFGEILKYIDFIIIDDDEWEENEVFFVKLLRFDYKDDLLEIGG